MFWERAHRLGWEPESSSKTSIFDNRNNTVEALVNDHLSNSDKWYYSCSLTRMAFIIKLVLTTSVVVIILNKPSFFIAYHRSSSLMYEP